MRNLALFVGVLLVVLIFGGLAIFASIVRGCSDELAGDVVVFGTAFDDQAGSTLLVWPEDATGERFRCIVGEKYGELHRTEARTLARKEGWSLDAKPSTRVLLILPGDASPELRARSDELLATLARWAPDAGQHRVFSSLDWIAADDGRAASLLLRRMAERSRKEQWQHQGILARAFDEGFTRFLMPSIGAVVDNAEERPFHIFWEGMHIGGTPGPAPSELSDPVDAAAFESRVQELIAKSTGKDRGFALRVVLLLASDLSEPALERATAMLKRLAEHPRLTVSLHRSERTLADLLAVTAK
ncbi:MAG: hypothetical protein ACYTEG_00360 [Planctomycetota bacterium]|jgi:hypothetical protein